MPDSHRRSLSAHVSCAILLTSLIGCQGNVAPWRSASSIGSQQKLRNPEKTHLAFARLSERTGKPEAARESYLIVLDQNPQSVEATIGLAGLDLRAGRIREAELGFLKAGELAPDDALVSEALGQFYLTQERFAEAETALRRGYAANPNDRRLQYRLGLALARQGRIPESEPLFVNSVGEAESDYNLGLILYEQGQTVAAEQRLLRAVMKKPTLNEAQHWLEVVRNERATQMIAQGPTPGSQQSPIATGGASLPYGVMNPAFGAQHTSQAELGTLTLAARQALEQQQLQRQQQQIQFPQHSVPQRPFPQHSQLPLTRHQNGLQQSSLQVTPGAASPLAAHPPQRAVGQHQTLDTTRMTATQLEQLQNSMTSQQRLALQRQAQQR